MPIFSAGTPARFSTTARSFGKLAAALALAFSLLTGSASGAAKTEKEIEAEIESVIVQRHPSESSAWWQALGPGAPKVIVRMHGETTQAYRRMRLLQALAWFPDSQEAVAFLKDQARTTDQSVVRNAAIKSVGISQGTKELEFISEFLKSEEPQTRLAAAKALKRMEDPKADERLKEFKSREKAEWLVAKIDDEPVKPKGPLLKVTSSEDRLVKSFPGTWKGFWMVPERDGKGLKSEIAALVLETGSAEVGLSGKLTLKKPDGKEEVLKVESLKPKGLKAAGSLVQSSAEGKSAAQPLEAEIIERKGVQILEVRVSGTSAVFVARKQ